MTLAVSGTSLVTPSGSEDWLIVRVKSSLISTRFSLFIGTLNETLVCPALNVTVYGPEL